MAEKNEQQKQNPKEKPADFERNVESNAEEWQRAGGVPKDAAGRQQPQGQGMGQGQGQVAEDTDREWQRAGGSPSNKPQEASQRTGRPEEQERAHGEKKRSN